jgi:hypothetical protein
MFFGYLCLGWVVYWLSWVGLAAGWGYSRLGSVLVVLGLRLWFMVKVRTLWVGLDVGWCIDFVWVGLAAGWVWVGWCIGFAWLGHMVYGKSTYLCIVGTIRYSIEGSRVEGPVVCVSVCV